MINKSRTIRAICICLFLSFCSAKLGAQTYCLSGTVIGPPDAGVVKPVTIRVYLNPATQPVNNPALAQLGIVQYPITGGNVVEFDFNGRTYTTANVPADSGNHVDVSNNVETSTGSGQYFDGFRVYISSAAPAPNSPPSEIYGVDAGGRWAPSVLSSNALPSSLPTFATTFLLTGASNFLSHQVGNLTSASVCGDGSAITVACFTFSGPITSGLTGRATFTASLQRNTPDSSIVPEFGSYSLTHGTNQATLQFSAQTYTSGASPGKLDVRNDPTYDGVSVESTAGGYGFGLVLFGPSTLFPSDAIPASLPNASAFNGLNYFYINAPGGSEIARGTVDTVGTGLCTTSSPIQITTTSLPNATIGLPYAATALTATGGTGSYTWSVVGGALPSGFTLNQQTGVISTSGPVASTPDTYLFTTRVTDSVGATGEKQLSLSIGAAPPVLSKDSGACDKPGVVHCGDPISIGSGNVYEQNTDYETLGPNKLAFTRYYNSLGNANSIAQMLGRRWRSNFDRYLILTYSGNQVVSVAAERPDSQVVAFSFINGSWRTDTDVDLKLSQTSSGPGTSSTWTLIDGTDAVESYATTGGANTLAVVTSIRMRNGYTQTLQYVNNQLQSVVDSFGRALNFSYQNGLLRTLTTPENTFTYAFTSSGAIPGVLDRLISITYSTSPPTSQSFLYENPSFPFALTGIIDENGNRYSSWSYDAAGRGTSSQLGIGIDLTTVTYNDSDGSRTVTNALGVTTVYRFTTLQGVPKITRMDRLPTATTAAASRLFTYDSNGYTASETDWNGNLTTYTNDSRGLPVSITEAAGTPQARTKTITYDPTFHLPAKIVEPGITTDLVYDGNGNLLSKTLTDTSTQSVPYSTSGTKRTWTYSWGAFGLMASMKGPRTDVNQTTTFAYDGSGTLIRTTNPLGQQTQVTLHMPGGRPLTVVDANNVTTQFSYDARLRLVSQTVNTAGGPRTTSYSYDAAGNVLSVTLPDDSKLTNAYDIAHRVTSVTDLFNQVTAYTLDAAGNRTRTDLKDAGAVIKRTSSAAFDALGRLIQSTGGAGQVTRYSYDSNGNTVSITDPLSRVTSQAFDPLNRRFRVTDPLNGITTTTFDPRDRPLTVTAPNGAVTSYAYSGFGDLIQQVSPDTGKTVYRYDLAGNLTQVTDARNVVQNHSYDALDRRISTSFPGGASENITLTYDQAGHGFGVGRLTSVSDEAGTLDRNYDELGNLISERRNRGAASLSTAFSFDAANRLSSILYPSGAKVGYGRDLMGRITAVSLTPSGAQTALSVVSGIAYQPYGPIRSLTYGNGVSGTRSFDLDYRLTNLTDGGIQNLTYGYNAADNVLSIADGVTAAANQTFGYDSLDRLTSAAGIYGSLTYTYDSVGNRLSQVAGAVTTNYTYSPQSNRLAQIRTGTATQVLAYTPSGSVTTIANVPSTRPGTGIAYNQAGRMARVLAGGQQTLAYTYDAFGRRLVKTGAGNAVTLYQYDSYGHLLEEATAQGAAKLDYIYLGDRPIATFTPGANTLAFLHTDRLGTPQKATSSAQAVVWNGNFEPFGGLHAGTSQTASLAQNLRLPGQEFEVETGWHQNGFRDYAPALGRYFESDPIGLPAGLNTFAYADNRPMVETDRFGLQNDSHEDAGDMIKDGIDLIAGAKDVINGVLLLGKVPVLDTPKLDLVNALMNAGSAAQNPTARNITEYVAGIAGLFPPGTAPFYFSMGVSIGKLAGQLEYEAAVLLFGQDAVDEALVAVGSCFKAPTPSPQFKPLVDGSRLGLPTTQTGISWYNLQSVRR